jgi:hypothetical protein
MGQGGEGENIEVSLALLRLYNKAVAQAKPGHKMP